MKGKYSLVHMTNPYCPPPELIRVAAKVGFDCVSLRTIPTRLSGSIENSEINAMKATTRGIEPFDIVKDKQLLLETKRAAKETGIIINDTENARIFDGVDVRNYEPDLEAAAELGVHHILTNIWTSDKSFYTEQFSLLCELAESYGLTVNLEFVTWASVKDLKDAKELLIASGAKNVGIVVDVLHAYRSKVQLSEFDELPQSWFNYLHLSDCEKEIPTDVETLIHNGRDERLYPGEGAIDIKAFINKIPHAVRGVEVPSISRIKKYGFEEHARRCFVAAKNCIGE